MRSALSKDGAVLVVQAATWEISDKVTFESLRRRFEEDPVMAWTHYGSQPRYSTDKAIRDGKVVLKNVNADRTDPWSQETGEWKSWFVGIPGVLYYAHFDLSKSRDRTGFGLVHWDEERSLYVVDAARAIAPPLGGDIDFADMRQILYDLTDRGFFIECVSYDMAFSAETRQILEKKGYRTEYCSTDRDMEAYDALIQSMLSGTLDYFQHHLFLKEMKELEVINGKRYDHPKNGSKDVSDAVAGALYMCCEDESRQFGDEEKDRDQVFDYVGLEELSGTIRRRKGPRARRFK